MRLDMVLLLVTEDRRESGIFTVLSVSDNVAIASVNQYRHGPLLSLKEIDSVVEDSIDKLSIKLYTSNTYRQFIRW